MNIPPTAVTSDPSNKRQPRRVNIGPVDSGHPGFDQDLRTYLAAQGFAASTPNAKDWTKEFADEIAADLAMEACFAQIGRLVGVHAPQLPNVSLL